MNFFKNIKLSPLTKAAIVIALVLGILFSVVNPLIRVYDESGHFYRAYVLAHGDWVSKDARQENEYGGYIPRTLDGDSTIKKEFQDDLYRPFDNWKELNVAPSKEVEWYPFPNTSSYSPINYIPSALAIAIGGVFHARNVTLLMGARILSLIFYTVAIAIALELLRKNQFQKLFFAIALLPSSLLAATQITADTMVNSVLIIFSALIIKNITDRESFTGIDSILLLLTGISVPLLKQAYTPLLLLLFIVTLPRLKKKVSLAIRSVVAIAGFLGIYIWMKLVPGVIEATRQMNPVTKGTSTHEQMYFIKNNLPKMIKVAINTLVVNGDGYIKGLVGLPSGFLPVPVAVVSTFCMICVIYFAIRGVKTNRNLFYNSSVILVCLASIALIFGGLYIDWTPIGSNIVDGVQGRYFLPLLPLLIASTASVVKKPSIGQDILIDTSVDKKIICFTVIGLAATLFNEVWIIWIGTAFK
jgi:uncharacterized membrane protein